MAKRTFGVLRDILLAALSGGQKTVNQLATESGVNWKTVDNHLIFLVGKGWARIVFSSQYVKIFELSEQGRVILAAKKGPKKNSAGGKL